MQLSQFDGGSVSIGGDDQEANLWGFRALEVTPSASLDNKGKVGGGERRAPHH